MESKVHTPPKLDLAGYLGANGLELKGINDEGNPIVADAEGNENAFDIEKFKQANKLPKNLGYVDANTPDSPMTEISPVNDFNRMALNIRGQSALPGASAPARDSVDFLKKKYDAAQFNEAGDLVVKTKGVWQKVTPDFFGNADPLEVTKAIVQGNFNDESIKEFKKRVLGAQETMVELAPSIVGGVFGGLPGAVAGTAISKGIKTILGKAVGIDNATPQEALAENAWDTMTALAFGKVIPPGFKAAGWVYEKTLWRLADKLAPTAKSFLSNSMAKITGIKPETMTNVLKDSQSASKVLNLGSDLADDATKIAGNTGVVLDHVEQAVANRTRPAFQTVLQKGSNDIQKVYGETLEEIKSLPKIGEFRISPENMDLTSAKNFAKLTDQELRDVYKIPQAATQDIRTLLGKIQLLSKQGNNGPERFEIAQQFKKDINEFYGKYLSTPTSQPWQINVKDFYNKVSEPFRKEFGEALKKVGGTQLMEKADDMWASTTRLRALSKASNDSKRGLSVMQAEFKKYINGGNWANDADIELLKTYGGKATKESLQMIDDVLAAKDFATMIPRGESAGQASVKGGLNTIFNPRLGVRMGQGAQWAASVPGDSARALNNVLQQYKTQLTSLAPAARDAFLSDPNLLIESMGQVLQTPEVQKNMTNKLLEEGLKK